ncbi:pyridoxamine 5'-phosphate oxidase [Candidatus Pelagibacter sp.]|nr:pyridoxamine 5'-phosphate oxidase [Candidatus Pelagibacter sp.]
MNQKNSLGLNSCFLDLDDPIELFKLWMDDAKKSEPNDPNAVSLATSNNNFPSVRMVLLKDFSQNGFVFYTNLNSQKGNDLKENPNAAMCFHWKSLLRQIRIYGAVTQVANDVADKYYNSRSYDSRIGAWASKQSKELTGRDQLIDSIKEYKDKYNDENNVPRPSHWSGWILSPQSIEFWLDGDSRIHERLKYVKDRNAQWIKSLLSP